jgi:deoxyribodipyrimidine photo-lyase
MYSKSLYIFRRDLRIKHNITYSQAQNRTSGKLYPCFFFTEEQVGTKNKFKSTNSIQFMIESLYDLSREIKKNTSGELAIFMVSNLVNSITSLVKKYDIDAIFLTEDYTPYARKFQNTLQQKCKTLDCDVIMCQDYNVVSPYEIKEYKKFTPYYNVHQTFGISLDNTRIKGNLHGKIEGNQTLDTMWKKLVGDGNPLLHTSGGRTEGLKMLHKVKNQKNYGETRDILSENTSFLSAYLKFGCVGAKEAHVYMTKHLGREHPIVRQLVWRDFYSQLLYYNPQLLTKSVSLKEKYDNIKWKNSRKLFNAWKNGETGFPIVDAGMRQLNNTGYMHNRARLVCASFLIKNLHIDWRWGEKYFATQLVDYDPASNNGNWQWVSGSGADSAPYFRIFSPYAQQERFDPDATYIKRWIPELSDLDAKTIHNWSTEHVHYTGYPGPIIDYAESRKITLDMYGKIM